MPTPASMPTTITPRATALTTTVVVNTIAPGGVHGGSHSEPVTYYGTDLSWEDENDILYIYNGDNGIATHARGTWLNVIDPRYTTPDDARDLQAV